MRVLICDHAARENHKAGVGYYTSELIRCARGILGDEHVQVFPGEAPWVWKQHWWDRQSRRWEYVARRPGWLPWVEKKFRGKFLSLVRKVMPPPPDDMFAVFADPAVCDLYHEPNYIPQPCDLPTVASVHDLSVLLHPEWHPAKRVGEFERLFAAGLRRCAHLFAISEFGKGEIVRHLGWPAEKVTVTHMGVRPGLRRVEGRELSESLRRLGLREGYLLHVGTLEPRKNVLMLMRAFGELPSEVRERRPLVLAGGKGWNSQEVHAYLHDEARHKNVRWLGYVADRDFPALYSGARALLFPTFYEGFGMPAVEMMACGGAVIASTAGAVAETAGGQAYLIDPNDRHAWRDALLRACADDDWARHLADGAERHAARFTWEACAEATVAAYRRVLAGSRRAA
jgi:alpha-1,3-rhamnosyl/mannosyltransferase